MFGWNNLIDHKTFHEMIGSDVEHLDTLIALFEEQSRENLESMQHAIRHQNVQVFGRAAHDLKNLGRNIASAKLVAHSQELERIASEPHLAEAAERIDETVRLLGRALKELRKLRRKWS